MMKVLVIEDNYYTRDILTRWLTRHGHQVVASMDGNQCLHLVQRERPNLILLDMRLPVMSGLDIARLLKADPDTRDIPIIAMTAYSIDESREQALAAGCDEYEPKPLDLGRLLAKMSALAPQAP
jgi:CheY-like chemotaxis protein